MKALRNRLRRRAGDEAAEETDSYGSEVMVSGSFAALAALLACASALLGIIDLASLVLAGIAVAVVAAGVGDGNRGLTTAGGLCVAVAGLVAAHDLATIPALGVNAFTAVMAVGIVVMAELSFQTRRTTMTVASNVATAGVLRLHVRVVAVGIGVALAANLAVAAIGTWTPIALIVALGGIVAGAIAALVAALRWHRAAAPRREPAAHRHAHHPYPR